MARYSVATTKVTGAAAGIIAELRTPATIDMRIYEIAITTETAVAGIVGIVRATNAGTTPGGAIVPQLEDSIPGATATTHNLYTTYGTEPTQAAVYLKRVSLSATIGSGRVWSFPLGLVVPAASGLLIRQMSALAVTYSVECVFDG